MTLGTYCLKSIYMLSFICWASKTEASHCMRKGCEALPTTRTVHFLVFSFLILYSERGDLI